MKKFANAALLMTAIICFAHVGIAQTESVWRDISGTAGAGRIVTDKAVARLSFPATFRLFVLDIEPLRQELFTVVTGQGLEHSTIISLPNADGQLEQFEVFEASNFEPDLQAQFPEIRAFSGKGITDRSATLKLSISPQGLQTMVFRTDTENEFIEAYSQDHTAYAVFRSQREAGQLAWTCSTVDRDISDEINKKLNNTYSPSSSAGQLKTMRLAQSCNGEYANYFGATSSAQVALVMAAYNATLTRCNGVYEKDLALHLNLIASTTSVIYYTPSSDPYTAWNSGNGLDDWNAQLQATLTSIIGEANYDIGHMFGASGGGGNAGCIGCVCTNGQKGSGITSPADGIPQGDNFDIDYVVHEVGHQLGANHTFSYALEGTGVNKEVGSGITIMGYAGITSRDVAPHSIDIFHEASIAQIQANLATKSCPVTTNITANNATPVVGSVSNYTIPISTPFALTGSATDANGDPLTYCWEQNDNSSTSGANSVASATKATGPNWLSFSPTTSSTRLFPKLATILAGALISGPLPGGDAGANTEALSSVSRTLNFRLTVRDNCPYSSTAPIKVGQTQFTDMTVTVSNTSGPFQVTSPNTAVSWGGNSSQTVTWLVNNTTTAPVSCANVKISLSTDGGQTFPTVLAASTPNDGTEALVIPNTPTTTARMKVEAVGNIFFDLSNTNFTVTLSTLATPVLVFPANNAIEQAVSLTVQWNPVPTATSYKLQLGTDSTFAGGMVINDSTITDTSYLASGLNVNTKYFWRVRAKNGGSTGSYSSVRKFTTVAPPAVVALVSPSNNATGLPVSTTLQWNTTSGALAYALQVSTDSTFGGGFVVNDSTLADTSYAANGLSTSTKYFWRVRASNAVGNGNFSTIRNFTTIAPPAAIVLVFPSANAIEQPSSLTLRWNVASVASAYALQVSTDSTFTGSFVANDSTLTDTLYLLSGLSTNTTYFWRVRGSNFVGNGNWSSVQEFTTITPPAGVILVSPPDNATGQLFSLALLWNAAPGATSYRLQVSTDSTFGGGIIVNDSTLTDTSYALSGLSASTEYFWRVDASNIAGTGFWSTTRRLATLFPPAALMLVSPPENAVDLPVAVTLRWNVEPLAALYWLQVSTDSTFVGGLIVNDSTLTDTLKLLSGLNPNTEYFWQVMARNAAGDGGWSSERKFATVALPSAVVLISPAQDAELPADSTTLAWNVAAPAVTAYWLEWSTDSLFSVSTIDSTLIDTLLSIEPLQDSTTYYWRVRGVNAGGWGPFSEVRRFATLFKVEACLTLISGWNLVSIPVYAGNDSSHVLFPACGVSYGFEYIPGSGYQMSYVFESGKGYWLHCSAGTCITGVSILRDTISVQAGWNVIGSVTNPVSVAGIVTDPPGIINSDVFAFDNGYQSVSSILPGGAYWVKVSQAGTIILDGTAIPSTGPGRTPNR